MPRLSLSALVLAVSCGLAAPLAVLAGAGAAHALEPKAVNQAEFNPDPPPASKGPNPFVVKAQALLGRRSISPGVIDGLDGENFRKAVAQFRRQENLGEGDKLDEAMWSKLRGEGADDIVTEYKITEKDAKYEFAKTIPEDYAKQAKMERLAYTSMREMLAERFHMDEDLLKALNPKASLKAGETINVINVKREKPKAQVGRIEANKSTGMVVVYSRDDRILASYPATIGSESTPSPTGEHKVTRIAVDPTYHYDPEKNFRQGDNTKKLVLPPGPNNPVGVVWIALSKPTYGIHGTPEPALVSKTASHGCVRLTNWDARELANMIDTGVTVRFTQ